MILHTNVQPSSVRVQDTLFTLVGLVIVEYGPWTYKNGLKVFEPQTSSIVLKGFQRNFIQMLPAVYYICKTYFVLQVKLYYCRVMILELDKYWPKMFMVQKTTLFEEFPQNLINMITIKCTQEILFVQVSFVIAVLWPLDFT